MVWGWRFWIAFFELLFRQKVKTICRCGCDSGSKVAMVRRIERVGGNFGNWVQSQKDEGFEILVEQKEKDYYEVVSELHGDPNLTYFVCQSYSTNGLDG